MLLGGLPFELQLCLRGAVGGLCYEFIVNFYRRREGLNQMAFKRIWIQSWHIS